jgi:hypothetical protein
MSFSIILDYFLPATALCLHFRDQFIQLHGNIILKLIKNIIFDLKVAIRDVDKQLKN